MKKIIYILKGLKATNMITKTGKGLSGYNVFLKKNPIYKGNAGLPKGVSGIKSAGNKLGAIGAGLIAYDIISQGGVRPSHLINSTMIGVSMVLWSGSIPGAIIGGFIGGILGEVGAEAGYEAITKNNEAAEPAMAK